MAFCFRLCEKLLLHEFAEESIDEVATTLLVHVPLESEVVRLIALRTRVTI